MNERLFFEQLLALPDLRVDKVYYENTRILLHCHSEQKISACPRCASLRDKAVKRYEERQIRDLAISGKEVWLYLRVRQFECECGHYYHEPFEWVAAGKSYTVRESKFVFELCAKQPFSEVGAIINMNVKTVERLYYQQAEAVIDLPQRYAQVRKIGIDEISLRKGKGEYCCVLTDLERGIQLDILPDRKKETLIAHFQGLGPAFCKQINHVSCDMWGPYNEVAKQCFPQAKVTIDRFHVVKALNDSLDTIRRTLRRTHPQQAAFKRLKWILFKRSKTLSDEQQLVLQQALDLSKELQEAYQLRNSFHDIFDQAQSKPEAQQRLEGWVQKVNWTQNPAWNKFLRTLTNWKDPILNFIESGISNAVTEGCNNLVRYIRRISFGIPNFEHMRLRVLVNST